MCISAEVWRRCNWTLLTNWAAALGALSSPVFVSDMIVDWLPAQLKSQSIILLHNSLKCWTGNTSIYRNADQASQNSAGLETGCKQGEISSIKRTLAKETELSPDCCCCHAQIISNTHEYFLCVCWCCAHKLCWILLDVMNSGPLCCVFVSYLPVTGCERLCLCVTMSTELLKHINANVNRK